MSRTIRLPPEPVNRHPIRWMAPLPRRNHLPARRKFPVSLASSPSCSLGTSRLSRTTPLLSSMLPSHSRLPRHRVEFANQFQYSSQHLPAHQHFCLGRSLPHLITTMTDLEEWGIGSKSLTENIDTTTSGGN
jgi:hypothetical protein